jgi:ankyrin repeat protein
VKILLETGRLDPDPKDMDERTPLHWASIGGHTGVVSFLLETGQVDINVQDFTGKTP